MSRILTFHHFIIHWSLTSRSPCQLLPSAPPKNLVTCPELLIDFPNNSSALIQEDLQIALPSKALLQPKFALNVCQMRRHKSALTISNLCSLQPHSYLISSGSDFEARFMQSHRESIASQSPTSINDSNYHTF